MVTTRSGVDSRAGGSNIRSRSAGKRAILGTMKISPKPKSSSSSTSQSSKSQTPETNMVDMIQDRFTDRTSSPTQIAETSPSASFTSSSTAVSTPELNMKLDPSPNVPGTATSGNTITTLSDLPSSSLLSAHPDDSLAGDDVLGRIVDESPVTTNDIVAMSLIGDALNKQDIAGKGKSSETRKTVTFQEPAREAVRTKSRVPIGDAHANIRILHTAETMGKKLYTQYIRRRYPTTTPPHDVPPEWSATQLIGLVVCQEPLYGLGWRVGSDELCRIMGYWDRLDARVDYFDWIGLKIMRTGFWDDINDLDYPALHYNEHSLDLSPTDDVFLIISYNAPHRRCRIVDADYRARLINKSASLLGFSPERRDQVEWHRKTEGENWQ